MSRESLPLALASSIVALLLVACSGDEDAVVFPTGTVPAVTGTATAGDTTEPSATTPAATPVADPTSVIPRPVGVVDVLASRTFERPVELGVYPGDRLFVVDQGGQIFRFNLDGSTPWVILDISAQISVENNEEGLLSAALDPDFASNGHLWTYYSAAGPRRSVLSRFVVDNSVADPESELVVLELEQPFGNHNGGAIRFGPDGMLYLGFGDGGSANDPLGSGQDRSTLLGSVIRIDVSGATEAAPYVIPADNPFVGDDDAAPELWAIGIRNPWRMAFDSATGELWLGDVGQAEVEEINVVRGGENYGWDITEGNVCHEPSSDCDTDGQTFPVAVYGHDEGRCSVTGGVVYRGTAVPEIAGNYVYADFCTGEVWALPADGSGESVLIASELGNIASFGVDAAGEVYVLRFGQSIVRLVSP